MTAQCENDLTDQEYDILMKHLEMSLIRYIRTIGPQLRLSDTTQNLCLKKALLTVLLDLVEHEPCDQARGEILEDLVREWDRRVRAMPVRHVAPTAH
jgi:hypothetical protein